MGKIEANIAGEEAIRLTREAYTRGLTLRLMGGAAVMLHCQSSEIPDALKREYADLDFAGLSKETPKITRFFEEMGYEPHRRFNAVLGSERLLFSRDGAVDHIDVILDHIRMCHTWDLRLRLPVDPVTLPLADLLLSKLQIVMLTEKDLKDIYLLLLNHDLGPGDGEQVNTTYLARLLGNDWGFWKTVTINLQKALEHIKEIEFDHRDDVIEKLHALVDLAENAPKSMRWKGRSVIGERMNWYELPGDVQR